MSSTPTDDLTVSPPVPEVSDLARASDTLDAALAYVARGYSVIPLVPGTKRPAVKLAPFLDESQRMTDADVRAYWSQNPQAGIAIVTGAPSGLVIVDVDPRNGGSVEAVLKKGCATGMVVHTGGGGTHFFLRHPGTPVPCGKTVLPGVDRKGDGGYVVAPPTMHPSGTPYAWVTISGRGGQPEGEPGELPAWVLEAPTPVAPDGEDRGQWVAETLAHPERVLPGTQEDTLTRLCWWAAGHLEYDVALAMLTLWASQLLLGNEHDPWTPEHVKDRLDRAFAKRTPALKVRLVDGTARQPGANHVEAKELRFVSYDELAKEVREIRKRPWLIPGWLRARGLFLIAGASHFGKTWLSIDLAVSAAIGGDFLGRYPVDPGPDGGRRVLYIVGEDDAPDFMERLDLVLAGKRAQPEAVVVWEGAAGHEDAMAEARATWARNEAFRRNFRVHYERQFLFGDPGAEAALLKMVQDFKPALVIFDPLKDLVPGEDVDTFFGKVVEYTRFLRKLRDVADCCVGIVHHTKKSLEWDAPDAGISGRNEFIASFEHRFICFRAPASIEGEPDDGTEISWSQGVIQRRIKSSPPLGPILVRYAGSGEEFVLYGEEVTEDEGRALVEGKSRSEQLAPRVLQIVQTKGPLSGRAVHRELKDAGVNVSRNTVDEALQWLEAAGRITRNNKGGFVPAGSRGPQAENLIGENGSHQGD